MCCGPNLFRTFFCCFRLFGNKFRSSVVVYYINIWDSLYQHICTDLYFLLKKEIFECVCVCLRKCKFIKADCLYILIISVQSRQLLRLGAGSWCLKSWFNLISSDSTVINHKTVVPVFVWQGSVTSLSFCMSVKCDNKKRN